jgi:hypothetical protein
MAEVYENLVAVARAHGVSKPAVSKWKRHPKWPIAAGQELVREAIDRFVAQWIQPHRAPAPAPAPAAAAVATPGRDDSGPPEGGKQPGKTPPRPTPPRRPARLHSRRDRVEPPSPEVAAAGPVPEAGAGERGGDGEPLDAAELERQLRITQRELLDSKNSADAELAATKFRGLKAAQEILIKDKELVSRLEVERGRTERIRAVKSRMMMVPAQVASQLVGLAEAEIAAVLTGEMLKICGEFARA